MKERRQQGKKGIGFALLVTYVLMIGALATYAMPVWRVEMRPLGGKSWSVHDLIKAIPKPVMKKSTESTSARTSSQKGFDFNDVLKKLSKPTPSGEHQKLSSTFVIGILIPIFLALTYLLVLLGLFTAPVKSGKPFGMIAGLSVLTSAYVLAATYYLSALAESSFAQGLQQAGQGIFAMLGSQMVPQLVIRPDVGLFVLFGLTVLIFVVNLTRKKA